MSDTDDVVVQDVAADQTDSSTVPASQPDPSQATSQPVAPGTGRPQTVPFDRFQQVIRQNQELRQQNAQVVGRVQELTSRLQTLEQRANQQGGLTAEQEQEYLKAGDALEKILGAHPRLKALLALSQHAPKLVEGYQGVQALTHMQFAALVEEGHRQIDDLAAQAGLPTDDKSKATIRNTIAGLIRTTPGFEERFKQRDLSVIAEAFEAFRGVLSPMQRGATASLVNAKNKTRSLPPAPTRGGLPGEPAPPKLDPSNPRAFMSELNKRAQALIDQRLGG